VHHRHKERWLHTRISADLDEALRREARKQRTPVSLVVRNVLEGALDLVEEIVEDGLGIADTSRRIAHRVSRAARGRGVDEHAGERADRLADVYGWQELVLNQAAHCGRCDAALGVGTSAHRGLKERPGRPVFLCSKCLRQLRRPGESSEQSPASDRRDRSDREEAP
jgi:hypothetical protein